MDNTVRVKTPLPRIEELQPGRTYSVAQLRAAGFTVDDQGDVFQDDDGSFILDAEIATEGSF